MNRVLIFTGKSETEIFKLSQKINELNDNGDISLGENIVVTKDKEGKSILKNVKGDVLPFTIGGALTGSILGLLGGPLGMMIGASLGSLLGLTGDVLKSDSESEYLDKIIKELPNEKSFLIAHIDEEWETPLDTISKELDIKISRINIDEEFEENLEKELEKTNKGIDELEDKLEDALEDAKEIMKKKIEELKGKRDEIKQNLTDGYQKQKEQYENWVADLKEKIKDKVEDVKEDLEEKRVEYLQKRINYQTEILEKLKSKI